MFKPLTLFAAGFAALLSHGDLPYGGLLHGAAQDPATAATTPAAERSTDEFQIDGAHSSVVFRVQHIQAAVFWGRFNQITGRLKVDDADLAQSFIRVEVPTESVDTNSAARDRHLKGPDFFSAKEFPTLSFESTKIEKAGADRYTVTGDLTLRGKTKTITLQATHTGTANVNERFGLRCGFEAILEIDRTDFGINFGADNGMLGKNVKIIIAIEGKLPS